MKPTRGILGCTFHDPTVPCEDPDCVRLGECALEVRFRELQGEPRRKAKDNKGRENPFATGRSAG